MERVWSALVVLIVLVLIVPVRPNSNTFFNNYPLVPEMLDLISSILLFLLDCTVSMPKS